MINIEFHKNLRNNKICEVPTTNHPRKGGYCNLISICKMPDGLNVCENHLMNYIRNNYPELVEYYRLSIIEFYYKMFELHQKEVLNDERNRNHEKNCKP